jgi:hypothetical protein
VITTFRIGKAASLWNTENAALKAAALRLSPDRRSGRKAEDSR